MTFPAPTHLEPQGMSGDACGRLRVTAWERYMALDHGPRHTMTVFSRFWLSQPVDRATFTAAVTAVARDHPLLAARREGGSWLPVPFDPDTQIDWQEASGPTTLQHQPHDDMLVRWTVRVGMLRDLGLTAEELAEECLADASGTLVILRFPHAIADVLGAVAVMRQVCAILAGRPAASPTQDDLDGRHTLRHTAATWRRNLPHHLARIARCFSRRPTEFSPDGSSVTGPARSGIACERVVASAATTTALIAGARAAGASVNDVLIAALFRTLAPHMDPRAVIRIAVPTSLRTVGNQAFCNQVSMVFLDREAHGAADSMALLRGVSAEMEHIKRLRLGQAMHMCLDVLNRAGAGLLWGATRLPMVWATAVLSNIGKALPDDAREARGLRVVALDALPPLRPGTSLAFLAVGHGGRLGLTVRYAPDRVSPERARQIVERTLAEAASLLGDQVPTGAAPVKPR